jgi:hypothetical protein
MFLSGKALATTITEYTIQRRPGKIRGRYCRGLELISQVQKTSELPEKWTDEHMGLPEGDFSDILKFYHLLGRTSLIAQFLPSGPY